MHQLVEEMKADRHWVEGSTLDKVTGHRPHQVRVNRSSWHSYIDPMFNVVYKARQSNLLRQGTGSLSVLLPLSQRHPDVRGLHLVQQ